MPECQGVPLYLRQWLGMANRCQFRKSNGKRCGANAQVSNGLCVFHDPPGQAMVAELDDEEE